MNFTTYHFIFLFLPIVFLGYRLFAHYRFQELSKVWLIGASIWFYYQGAGQFVFLFLGVALFNYIIGAAIIKSKHRWLKRTLLTFGLIENIVVLGYFKYTNFLIDNINLVVENPYEHLNIALPLGISFFTFQLIAYLVDCNRGVNNDNGFINFLVFITFFPQLILGPIVYHRNFNPQLRDAQQTLFNKYNMMLGIFLFSIGAAKKVLLANPLTEYGAMYFTSFASLGTFEAWLGTFSYTFAYYFDLSGYADMAIGLGLFFNLLLPQNFNSPYKARNFREYWQRWHITLSKFLSHYVFRSVFRKERGSLNFYMAVMFTFFISGLWHGAGWTFILWGLINGVFVCMAHFMMRRGWALPFFVAWGLTFIGILALRIIIVSTTIGDAWTIMKQLFNVDQFANLTATQIAYELYVFISYNLTTFGILLVAMIIAFCGKNTETMKNNFKPSVKNAVIAAILLGLVLLQMSNVSDFLYIRY
jgi:alginate O-acetyltransferase complex protein AlgI